MRDTQNQDALVVVVVQAVCERVVYRHGATLLMLRARVEFQDREQVEVREKIEARDSGRRQNKRTTNAQMWINMFYEDTSCNTLNHNVMCAQG